MACMTQKRTSCRFFFGYPEGTSIYGCRPTLKLILKTSCQSVDCIRLAEHRDMWWSVLPVVVNLLVPKNAENILSRLAADMSGFEDLRCVEPCTVVSLKGTNMMEYRYNFSCIVFVS